MTDETLTLIVPLHLWDYDSTGIVIDAPVEEWIKVNLSTAPDFTLWADASVDDGMINLQAIFGNASDYTLFKLRWT